MIGGSCDSGPGPAPGHRRRNAHAPRNGPEPARAPQTPTVRSSDPPRLLHRSARPKILEVQGPPTPPSNVTLPRPTSGKRLFMESTAAGIFVRESTRGRPHGLSGGLRARRSKSQSLPLSAGRAVPLPAARTPKASFGVVAARSRRPGLAAANRRSVEPFRPSWSLPGVTDRQLQWLRAGVWQCQVGLAPYAVPVHPCHRLTSRLPARWPCCRRGQR